jgi:hypothetical protein
MTDPQARARDEQLIAAMTVVLTAGHTIQDAEGELRVIAAPEGLYLVTNMDEEPKADYLVREEFDDVHAAVRYYLDLCDGLS